MPYSGKSTADGSAFGGELKIGNFQSCRKHTLGLSARGVDETPFVFIGVSQDKAFSPKPRV
jgi:hypothetical protein